MSKMTVKVNCPARETMSINLLAMQESGELCDFTITVQKHCIQAHRCILAANCEYFRTMFKFNETEPVSTMDLTHLECCYSVVAAVIRSFYTHEIELDKTSVASVLCLADYLMCGDIQTTVENYMDQTLGFYTAYDYFILAVQYNLGMTSLFQKALQFLWFRFHDFFIHQPDTMNVGINILQSFHQYGIFHNCTPLQILEVFLKHFDLHLPSHDDKIMNDCVDEQPDSVRNSSCSQFVTKILDIITCVLKVVSKDVISIWVPYLINYLGTWHDTSKCKKYIYSSLIHVIHDIQNEDNLHSLDYKEESTTSPQLSYDIGKKNSSKSLEHNVRNESEDFADKPFDNAVNKRKDMSEVSLEVDGYSDNFYCKIDERVKENISSNQPPSSSVCSGIALLAPTAETASQVMATDEGEWPRVSSPNMTLTLYDPKLRVWRALDLGEWPIAGPFYERHAWRIAVCHHCLYCFSLNKAVGLEFDLHTKTWIQLKCDELFIPHNEASPVKSVIPIDVGGKLIVLSMSRECMPDGSFSTLQNFYELDFHKKTFTFRANVQGDNSDMPITQWTRQGCRLVTVKASSMMYRNICCIQHIHEYDSETHVVQSHRVQSAMESGVRLLLDGGMLHVMDREGWCRTFNLAKSDWCNQTQYPAPPSSAHTAAKDSIYPALTRVTCHAGSSRWEVITHSPNVYSANTEEVFVTESGSISSRSHPPPPCQYLTALCAANVSQTFMDNLPQARFDYVESKNI